jgi:maltooligosyltrehalose trehalohydrolase
MDAQWSDDFHHSLFTVLTSEGRGKGYYSDFGSFEKLAKSLTHNFVQDGTYSTYRRRSHGRPADDLSPHLFLGYIQNHDQVGNRAVGDRVDQTVGLERAKVAAGIVLTAPFIPMIFQGEEYAASTPFQYFADHEDREMARSVQEGRQSEFAAFGWAPEDVPDPEKVETFLRSKLNWGEVHEGPHAEMLEWYRRLIALRRGSSSLNDGTPGQTEVLFDEESRWLTMTRGAVIVMCNLGSATLELNRPKPFPLLLGSRPDVGMIGNCVVLPPNTVAVLSGEERQRPV